MAEPISIQQLKDASEDAITLADFIYKPANVMIPRRLAADINSLQYYLDYMSSYAQHSYETYDEMVANAPNLPNGVSAFVTNDLDTAKNGIYTYNGTSFVKGDYQPENVAKEFVEAKLGGLEVFDGKVRAQDVSTLDGGTQDVKNSEFRNELDALPFEDGVLADTFVTVENTLNQRQINRGFESVVSLAGISNPKNGLRVYVKSFHAGLGVGGGYFIWDSTVNKSQHNGISLIDPSLLTEISSPSNFGNYFTPTGVGTGLFRREGVSDFAFVEWAGVHESVADNSKALKAVFASFKGVKLLNKKTYKHSETITMTVNNQYIESQGGGMYSGGTIYYTGVGTQFIVKGTVGYLNVRNVSIHSKGIDVGAEYLAGTTCFDLTDGHTCIICVESWIQGFEVLFRSNFNSFYNKFVRCRLMCFKHGLYNFANYNLHISENRVQIFNNFLTFSGNSGALVIANNSFERFNGYITNAADPEGPVKEGNLTFTGNYVEVYSNEALPTNFPRSSGNFPNNYGNNILFVGYYGTLTVTDCFMHLNGVRQIGYLESCRVLTAKRNTFTDWETGSSLAASFTCLTAVDTLDIINKPAYIGGTGNFSTTYKPLNISINKTYGNLNSIDILTGTEKYPGESRFGMGLLNGWKMTAGYGTGVQSLKTKYGVVLSGVIDGTVKTGAVICYISDAKYRPLELNKVRQYALLQTSSGGTVVNIRYSYEEGTLELVGSPTDVSSISLDGIIIPNRA